MASSEDTCECTLPFVVAMLCDGQGLRETSSGDDGRVARNKQSHSARELVLKDASQLVAYPESWRHDKTALMGQGQ
jgi:hypothetical protein